MQPLQYDVRCPAAKANSITHAAAAPSNLDAAITMRFAKTELQNKIELCATASEIAAPEPGSRRRRKKDFEHFSKIILNGKSPATKICWQVTIAALGRPLQYSLRCPAAKDNSITRAAAAPSNLDAAINHDAICKGRVAKHKNYTQRRQKWQPRADLDAKAKQYAAHEPICSHVEHFCETSYLNSLHFSTVTVPVRCRLWNAEEGAVQSVECWSVMCGVQSVE